MPEAVTYSFEENLIRVRSWGTTAIEDWNASRERILELHEIHGADRVLVDLRDQDSTPGIIDIFDFGSRWPHTIWVGLLAGPKTIREQRFLETVAINRGIPFRLFESEQEAYLWLRADGES